MNKVRLLNTEYIYPIFKITSTRGLDPYTHLPLMEYLTYIRKQKDNIWYLIPVRYNYQYDNSDKSLEKEQTLQIFLTEVYKVLLFYIIDVNAVNIYGESMIFQDEDQRSEEERLNLNYEKSY